jgi:hypothetical protein
MAQVSAKEIADAVEKNAALPAHKRAAADVNNDGQIDEKDVELLADAQVKLANKISGAIIGMEALTDEEKKAAERNQDGHVNLTDSYRLADDARAAKGAAARIKRSKTGKLGPI